MSPPTSKPSAKRRKIWDPRTFMYVFLATFGHTCLCPDALFYFSYTQAPVKLQVTKGKRTLTWYLNKKLLVQKSTKFQDLLSITDTVSLDSSTEDETMERFAIWISTGNLVIPELDPDSSESDKGEETNSSERHLSHRSWSFGAKRKDPIEGSAVSSMEIRQPWFLDTHCWTNQTYGRLLDLYLFAYKYEIATLKTEVLIRWQRHSVNCGSFPSADILSRLLLALPLGDGLVRYQITDFGQSLAVEGERGGLEYGCLPAPFLAELLNYVQKFLSAGAEEQKRLMPDFDWCEFHDHPESERMKCRRSRPNDPDTLYGQDEEAVMEATVLRMKRERSDGKS